MWFKLILNVCLGGGVRKKRIKSAAPYGGVTVERSEERRKSFLGCGGSEI